MSNKKSARKSPNAGKVTKSRRSKDAIVLKRIGDADHKVDLTAYERVKSASGNASLDNGDEVAKRLRAKTIDEVYSEVAKATGETAKQLRANYGHLNVGMQRMNLGNKLRGALRAQ